MNAPFATIWRADSPLARCKHCGVQRQFHGLSDHPLNALDRPRDHAFEAETADDLDPAYLSNADLIRNCDAMEMRANKSAGDEMRILECRAEISARIKAVFGVGFDDLRQTMGW